MSSSFYDDPVGIPVESLPNIFRADLAQHLRATYQISLRGTGGGDWTVRIDQGKCEVRSGKASNADVIIATDVETWNAVTSGLLDGESAYYSGRITVNGDLYTAQHFASLFRFKPPMS